jgi:hypothetical protein
MRKEIEITFSLIRAFVQGILRSCLKKEFKYTIMWKSG